MIEAIKKFKYHIYILLAAVWMAFIFFNSSLGGEASSGLSEAVIRLIHKVLMWLGNGKFPVNLRNWVISDSFHFLLRKTAHFVEFGILGILLFLSLGIFRKLNEYSLKRVIIATAISFIYAITDEVHQLFIPERICSIWDVVIDTTGAVIGVCCVSGILYLKGRSNAKRKN